MDAQDLNSDQQENSGQRNADCQFLPVQLCFKTRCEVSFRKVSPWGIQPESFNFFFFIYTIRLFCSTVNHLREFKKEVILIFSWVQVNFCFQFPP